MDTMDLNLLAALDALLAEGSVTGAARRLGLSASAMSRTLARLRSATGDPLLVRAGRGLVPTPHAAELRDRVHALTRDVRTVLTPACQPSGRRLARTDLYHSRQRRVCWTCSPLPWSRQSPKPRRASACASRLSPTRMRVRFGRGRSILEIGVLGAFAPEVRTQSLFRDDFVGVARIGHPLLSGTNITPERYAACDHVVASRKGEFTGPVDDALEELGLQTDDRRRRAGIS